MAIKVLGEVKIGELDQFLGVFADEGQAKRAEHGCVGTTVYAPAGETGRVIVLLEFEDRAAYDGFRQDPTVPPVMRNGGAQGPPVFTVLDEVARYDH